MTLPSDEGRICAMFDSFCKKVSRNYLRDLERAERRRDRHYSDEPTDYLLELLGHEDEYPSESFVLYVGGHPCVVEREILYKALSSLPEKQRSVLLLDFWRGFTDGEIAEELEVTARTVYNLRKRAYRAIREFYEREHISPWAEL